MASIYDIAVTTIDGKQTTLEQYRGNPVLVVNTASECGLTPQYEGLESLWQEFRGDGLTVLGFPCNQFGAQEPGTEEEIQQFCTKNYGVTFPLFAKVDVNGEHAHPLFQELRARTGGDEIQWNFEKFLIGADGSVTRFSPKATPAELHPHVLAAVRGATPSS